MNKSSHFIVYAERSDDEGPKRLVGCMGAACTATPLDAAKDVCRDLHRTCGDLKGGVFVVLADDGEQVDPAVPHGGGPDFVLHDGAQVDEDAVFDAIEVDAAVDSVDNSGSLVGLMNALNELQDVCSEKDRRVDDLIDMVDLPTFGGKEPESTDQVWSWNQDHLLIQDGMHRFQLVGREAA